MTIVDHLAPLAAEAGTSSIAPLWLILVIGSFALSLIAIAVVVWAVIRLTR